RRRGQRAHGRVLVERRLDVPFAERGRQYRSLQREDAMNAKRLLVGIALLVAAQANARNSGSFDIYGYVAYDSTGSLYHVLTPAMSVCFFDQRFPPVSSCSYNYVDASGGTALSLVAPKD